MTKEHKTILVVDDTESTRYAIARTLLTQGYKVIEAGNGQDALNLVMSEKPDLVTLDIHLPDMLGFEVCRRIKSSPATAYIPVLQVSASYVSSKDRIHGLEGGADSYLTHPFEPPVLLATVKALLRNRSLHEDLELSEERFRVALKNAPIMIYTCDLDLKYTWIYNPPGNLAPSDFVGRTVFDVFNAKDARTISDLKKEALRSNAGQRDIVYITINHIEHCFDITIEPLRDAAGEKVGLTVACIDVTERVKAENEQKKATEDAELANQAKTRFLSNMSHEIRTPLGVIQGFSELASDPNLNQNERQGYLQTIKRNALSLTKLLGEILDLSKIEAGRIEIEKTKFSLSDLLTEIISAFGLQAKEKGIYLQFATTQPFPSFITSDSTRLRQILINLISNSLKFTSRGGINLVASMDPGQSHGDSTIIKFEVKDTGIGLSGEHKTRLFQPFTQADSSTTRKFGGTGLGLSLSKKLAQSLGGDLILQESVLGEGSTFELTIDAGPLSPQDFVDRSHIPSTKDIPSLNRFSNRLNGMKLLLVEDSLDNQLLFTKYLQIAGAAVDIATDGKEAIEKGMRSAYDVILMDVQMPNVDGYQATSELRAGGLSVPIVALTAHASREERQRALSRGFTEYLIKPLSATLLIDTIASYRKEK